MLSRYQTAFAELSRRHPDGDIAIVTHGYGVHGLLMAFCQYDDLPLPDYCAATRVRQQGDSFTVELLCDASHWVRKREGSAR